MHRLAGARCLDLFAGSGALGIESLSRGAAHSTFVESNTLVAKQLGENLQTLAAQNRSELICADALSWLNRSPAQQFDLVFLDPPFQSSLLEQSLEILLCESWLSPAAHIYVEHERRSAPPKLLDELEMLREKSAGQCRYALYRCI